MHASTLTHMGGGGYLHAFYNLTFNHTFFHNSHIIDVHV